MSEVQLQKTICDRLLELGFMVVRVNSLKHGYLRSYHIHNTKKFSGMSDVIAVRGGQVYFVEVKTATGELRAQQIEFRELCQKFGAVYLVVRSLSDLDILEHQTQKQVA